MDIWPGSRVQHVKPKQQTNECQCNVNVLRKELEKNLLSMLSAEATSIYIRSQVPKLLHLAPSLKILL
jgi:hypothetical protein